MKRIRRWIRPIVWMLVLAVLFVLVTVPLLAVVRPVTTSLMIVRSLQGQAVIRHWVDLRQISVHVVRAVVVSEDSLFCQHRGIDWRAVETVLEEAAHNGRPRGASTITMQLAKNLFLWPQRSYLRKALEVPLALYIELVLSKRRILEIYLNSVEFGPGLFGIEAASRHYFNMPASRLGPRSAARLATTLPNPLARNPARPSRLHRHLAARVAGRARISGGLLDCL